MANGDHSIASSKPVTLGEALSAGEDERQQQLEAASNSLREVIEVLAREVRDLVLAQPPIELLGYVWGQFLLGAISNPEGDDDRPDKQLIERFQFALEYLHAIWSTQAVTFAGGALDEEKAKNLVAKCDELRTQTMMQCMASSMASTNTDFGTESSTIEFHAKSAWVCIRGHRYQVLEEEFFSFVLKPHDAALLKAYGIDSQAIAAGVQAAADAIRTGHDTAVSTIRERMEESHALVDNEQLSLKEAIERLNEQDATFASDMTPS